MKDALEAEGMGDSVPWLRDVATNGKVPIRKAIEPTPPPGEMGVLCEIGTDSRRAEMRVVRSEDAATGKEFWKLPPVATECTLKEFDPAEYKGPDQLPNLRYRRPADEREYVDPDSAPLVPRPHRGRPKKRRAESSARKRGGSKNKAKQPVKNKTNKKKRKVNRNQQDPEPIVSSSEDDIPLSGISRKRQPRRSNRAKSRPPRRLPRDQYLVPESECDLDSESASSAQEDMPLAGDAQRPANLRESELQDPKFGVREGGKVVVHFQFDDGSVGVYVCDAVKWHQADRQWTLVALQSKIRGRVMSPTVRASLKGSFTADPSAEEFTIDEWAVVVGFPKLTPSGKLPAKILATLKDSKPVLSLH